MRCARVQMGASFLIILEVFKYVGRKHRRLFFLRALGPLVVTILSIAIMNIFKLYNPGKAGPLGISTVGPIPKGLPGYTGNLFFPFVGPVGKTFGLSVVVCLIDLTESISIARALAIKNRCAHTIEFARLWHCPHRTCIAWSQTRLITT